VVEVRYDHFSGNRFRHGTKLLRWRPDKSPKQCKLDQVEQKVANSQVLLLAAGAPVLRNTRGLKEQSNLAG
jgi:hypothetical protein